MRFAGTGGSDFRNLKAEFSDVPFDIGVVGMARGGDDIDSANSQFFIMVAPKYHLNGQYTVVGRVVAGQDVVNAIKLGSPIRNVAVAKPDYMERVRLKSDIEE